MKNNKGITLIALVITIIVMLILVGVTISMAVNGGLFNKAGEAVGKTENEIEAEKDIAYGGIEVNGVKYDTVEDYMNRIPSTGVRIELGKTGTRVTNVPVPTGFTHTEGTIDTGYVIQDGDGNEFVWVPVDKNQKITIEVESKEDIDKLEIYDPYGDLIWEVEDGDIETTYSKVDLEPTVNGMYMAVAKTQKEGEEEPTITQKTLTVKSLYAFDTYNDWYTTDEYAKKQDADTIEDYVLEIAASELGLNGMEQVLAAFGAPTVEVVVSMYGTQAWWSRYQKMEDYSTNVEKNGGFYIARYEAGAPKVRTSGNSEHTVDAIITSNEVPVSKEEYAPYNYVTHGQALGLAERMYKANDEYEVSLITGSGWDRTVGWIYETKGKSASQIYEDSGSWGNYYDVKIDITKGKYSENYGSTYTDTEVSGKYTKPANKSVLLTTGATTRNSTNNIFDLAGNVWEWTLESYTDTDGSSSRTRRGGSFGYDGCTYPVFGRNVLSTSYCNYSIGFRPALYLK